MLLFLSTLFKKIKDEDIFASASQLTYYLILSFCPLLIFIVTIINHTKLDILAIFDALSIIVPDNVYSFVFGSLQENANVQNSNLLGISLLLIAWSASAGFRGFIKAVNKAFNIKEKRNFIIIYLISIICTFSLGLIIIAALILLVFWGAIEQQLIQYLYMIESFIPLIRLIRYLLIIVVMIISFSFMYKFLPSIKISWANVLPGATISTIGWILSSLVYSKYLTNYSNISTIYGSLGIIFALVIWLYITSFVFILGIEVNSVLLRVSKIKESSNEELKYKY